MRALDKVPRRNQLITIAGDATSGKSYQLKQLRKFLIKAGTERSDWATKLHHRLCLASEALNLCGNVATAGNPDSTQYVTQEQLQFDAHGNICGARIEFMSLVDPLRVASPQLEQYNIFHHLPATMLKLIKQPSNPKANSPKNLNALTTILRLTDPSTPPESTVSKILEFLAGFIFLRTVQCQNTYGELSHNYTPKLSPNYKQIVRRVERLWQLPLQSLETSLLKDVTSSVDFITRRDGLLNLLYGSFCQSFVAKKANDALQKLDLDAAQCSKRIALIEVTCQRREKRDWLKDIMTTNPNKNLVTAARELGRSSNHEILSNLVVDDGRCLSKDFLNAGRCNHWNLWTWTRPMHERPRTDAPLRRSKAAFVNSLPPTVRAG